MDPFVSMQHNKLKSLEEVDIYGIRVAPKMEKMKHLVTLDISHNQVSVVCTIYHTLS